jgi:DNA transformation protein
MDTFKDFVLDQLDGVPNLKCRSMFGAYGLYSGEKFFGIIDEDRLYFKTSDTTRRLYEERGMKPFRAGPKQILKTYYEVPADVMEDRMEMLDWAHQAIASQAKTNSEWPQEGAKVAKRKLR